MNITWNIFTGFFIILVDDIEPIITMNFIITTIMDGESKFGFREMCLSGISIQTVEMIAMLNLIFMERDITG